MTITKDLIDKTIKDLPTFTDEQLIYYFKCSLTKQSAQEKPLYSKLIKAIETERRARNKIQIITEDPDDTAASAEP